MKNISGYCELLAPAGSVASMKAALSAGADAVYMGGSSFGARAYADNPQTDELLKAIDYVHIRGKKLYLTVNTLLKNDELYEQLYGYMLPYYEQGVDAVIVQDLGVMAFIKKYFPGLPIHASTQMTVTGVHSAMLLEGYGVKRVVTARELSLDELKRIRENTHLEMETFVHGAICYSYSGQCLFSSLAGGRSGNRGRCAQPCRKPYVVKDENGKTLNKASECYVLSLKDMNTLDLAGKIMQAGVNSLKIEGRMKGPEYTAGVVSIYRKYMDLYMEYGSYETDKEDQRRLMDLFNRNGFSGGYYFQHNSREMLTLTKPQFRTHEDSWKKEISRLYIESELKTKIKENVTICKYLPAKISVGANGFEVSCEGDCVLEAKSRPISEKEVIRCMSKLGETDFEAEEINAYVQDGCFMTVGQLNDLRRQAVDALYKEMLSVHRRHDAVLFGKEMKRENETAAKGKWSYSAAVCSKEQLVAVCDFPEISRVYLECTFKPDELKEAVKYIHSHNMQSYYALPRIFRISQEKIYEKNLEKFKSAGFDGYLAKCLEAFAFIRERTDKPVAADHSLYAVNDMAGEWLMEMGAEFTTASVELNESELGGVKIPQELIGYGRLPMMVSANCLLKTASGCQKKNGGFHRLSISDESGREFPVFCLCGECMNVIFNCAPLYLLDYTRKLRDIAPRSVRLVFTTETAKQTRQVLEGIRGHQTLPYITRGHLKRGVE